MKKIIILVLIGIFAMSTIAATTANDINLDPNTAYGTLVFSQSGTELDPIVVNANGAHIQCVEISGQWIVFRGGNVHGCNSHGIYITGQNIVVENNDVYDTVRENNQTASGCRGSGAWGSAIKVRVGGENVVIRGNVVHENCGEGIAITRGINVVVSENVVYDNFSVNIYTDNSYNVRVLNNVAYCTGVYLKDGERANAITIGEEYYSGWGAQLNNVLVQGNDIRDCKRGIMGYDSDVNGTYRNITIDNNVIHSATHRSISWDVSRSENVVISNNKVYSTAFWIKNSSGVTLTNNTLIGSVTLTPAPPTQTRTATIPPTVTMTRTATLIPTVTQVPSITPIIPPTQTIVVPTSTPIPTQTPTPDTDVCFEIFRYKEIAIYVCPLE